MGSGFDTEELGRRLAAAADRVLLFIRLRLGPGLRARVEPMDVLQETYAAALSAWERFEGGENDSLVRWLCRIAETAICAIAERGRAKKRTPPGDRERLTVILDEVRDTLTGPATAADRAESHERLGRAVEGLPEDERGAVLARFFLSRTFEEIAGESGISESAARRLVGRATRKLGELLR